MDIYVFSSRNLTNIWAGIGARLWAVSKSSDSATHQGRITKSRSMRVGSLGILYCNETQALTTPFIVYSQVDVDREVTVVWPEPWVLPFRMLPLGSPEKQLAKEEAKRCLPIFKRLNETNFGRVFHVQAVTVFSPTEIGSDDWAVLIDRLAG